MNLNKFFKYLILSTSIFFSYTSVYANETTEKVAHEIKDSVITAEVKSAFIAEKLFGEAVTAPDLSIHVKTRSGVVILSGKADNEDQLARAIEIAKSVKGVKKVKSRVTISNR